MIRRRDNNIDDIEAKMEAALVRYGETKSPADHAEVLRLYEAFTRFKAGCGACIAGRNLFIKGLADIAAGNGEDGLNKMRGAMKSVRFKFDIVKSKLGL